MGKKTKVFFRSFVKVGPLWTSFQVSCASTENLYIRMGPSYFSNETS